MQNNIHRENRDKWKKGKEKEDKMGGKKKQGRKKGVKDIRK